MFKLGTTLMITCLVCVSFLVGVYNITRARTEGQEQEKLSAGLKMVLDAADKGFSEKERDGFIYYEGRNKKNEVVGYCFTAEGKGYGGPIKVLIGLDQKGKVSGIKIIEHQETPGVGSQIAQGSEDKSEPIFTRQFKGKAAAQLVLTTAKTDENIQAISGATISSRAVTETVKLKVEEFLKIVKLP